MSKRKKMLRRQRDGQVRPHFDRRTPPGAAPGTIAVDPSAPRPIIRAIAYGPDHVVEEEIHDIARLKQLRGQEPILWVNVDGLGDAQTILELGRLFGLHDLALEDVVNVHQRPKVEDYGDHLFLVARMFAYRDCLESDQMSLFVGRDFVVTFQEQPGDCWDPVRERLRKSRGRLRQGGSDYLAYSLVDAVVDGYFPVLERYGERLDELDENVLTHIGVATLHPIHDVRAELLLLRREIWPLRDVLSQLIRESHVLISADTQVYFRDCHDHTVQIIDLVETSREVCSDLRDYCLSVINTRMSEVMKVLTIIATLFMPLSFIAGLYGMNFDTHASPYNMPELTWRFGYPFALGVMASTAIGMLTFFWRRGWLGK